MGRGGEDENPAGKEQEQDNEPAYESDSDKDPLMDKKDLFIRHNQTKEDAKDTSLMACWLVILCIIMTCHLLMCGLIMVYYEDWTFETGCPFHKLPSTVLSAFTHVSGVYFALVTMSTVGYGKYTHV